MLAEEIYRDIHIIFDLFCFFFTKKKKQRKYSCDFRSVHRKTTESNFMPLFVRKESFGTCKIYRGLD